jgi:hypothetical protein
MTHTTIMILSWSHWVTAKIGLNGLDPDLDQNKHRINLEWVTTKIGLKPRLFRLHLDQI